jgi:protein HIRA/HIR1
VRVWSLAPVLSEAAEGDASAPRQLAALHDHNAPVNVARFSRDGKRIASGSDDSCVLISELRPGAGGPAFGGGGGPGGPGGRSVENWRPSQWLKGHSSNIADLAWSPDGSLLATASVDSTVGIWSVAQKPYTIVRFLSEHVGHVKGVAWDPLGRYLASQGDDGVRVWAVDGWTQVVHLAADFKYASKQMFNLR